MLDHFSISSFYGLIRQGNKRRLALFLFKKGITLKQKLFVSLLLEDNGRQCSGQLAFFFFLSLIKIK